MRVLHARDDHVGKGAPGCGPNPSEDEIRHAIAGNMCRCTGYVQIVESIQHAAELLANANK